MTEALGLDMAAPGDRPGWILTHLVDGTVAEIDFVEDLATVQDRFPHIEAIGVDAPIGHGDPLGGQRGGRRAADVEARSLLGDRSPSVFPVPPLDLLAAEDHSQASREADERGTIKPSIQLWRIRERVLEANRIAGEDERWVETHPEVSFHRMAGESGTGLADLASKRVWDGLAQRRTLLASIGLEGPGPLDGPAGQARPDDVLDSLAAAVSARRVAEGKALAIPERTIRDPKTRRPVRIHA